jgi:hypothetical protein
MGNATSTRQPSAVQGSFSANVITVAGQPGGDVPSGTLSKILRDAGLKKSSSRDDQEPES